MKKKFDFTAEMKEVQVTKSTPQMNILRRKTSAWYKRKRTCRVE